MLNNVDKGDIPIKSGKTTRVEFTMQDTFNEDGVKKIAVEHRGCRFPEETRTNTLFNVYSSDSCYLEVRRFFFFFANIPPLLSNIFYFPLWADGEVVIYNPISALIN